MENVGKCLWGFTIPKMLRPYFMYQRELLGDLVRLAYETIHELMREAAVTTEPVPGWSPCRRHLDKNSKLSAGM